MEKNIKNSHHEFPLSKESLLYMKLLAARCGMDLDDYRREAIYNRLVKRMRILKLTDFDSYCMRLRLDLEEEAVFINLIANTTTSFFREPHHFEYLRQTLLPALIAQKKRIRIWSAGCSTGEEAYSIAMVVRETVPDLKNYDIKILATDINSDAIFTAETGIYETRHISKMTLLRQKIWFSRTLDKNESLVEVDPKLKELISFNKLNLIDAWPFNGPFDVIFCRNVIIYFKNTVHNRLLIKMDNLLEVGSTLILGHSENIDNIRHHYETKGSTIYEKIR